MTSSPPRSGSVFSAVYLLQIYSGVWLERYTLSKEQYSKCCSPPTVVGDYIHHELSLGRISGPYLCSMCPDVHINRFGIISKSYQQDTWWLITNLSYLSGSSVNDGIPSQLCSLAYVTIDDAILNIPKSGNTILAKVDIRSAFRYYQCIQQTDIYLKWDAEVRYA